MDNVRRKVSRQRPGQFSLPHMTNN